MSKASKVVLISIIAIFTVGAAGGWTWIIKDKERARIEGEQAAVKVVAEVASSKSEKKIYNTPPIKASSKASVSSVAGQEPLGSESPETDGQNTGDASKPDLEPPPPPESSEDSKQETVSKPASSSAAPKEEKPVSSKSSNTPKMGDTKIVDGKQYNYIDGFGWVPNSGGKSTTTDSKGDINKQIGQMG